MVAVECAKARDIRGVSSKAVGEAFAALVKVEKSRLLGVLFNWNESELNEDEDKIVCYPGRDGFSSTGKNGGKSTVSKKEFFAWLYGDGPFDETVYGPEIATDREWRGDIETLRERAGLVLDLQEGTVLATLVPNAS